MNGLNSECATSRLIPASVWQKRGYGKLVKPDEYNGQFFDDLFF